MKLTKYILDDTFKFYQRSPNNSGMKAHVLGVHLDLIEELMIDFGSNFIDQEIKRPGRNRNESFLAFANRLRFAKYGRVNSKSKRPTLTKNSGGIKKIASQD